MTGASIAHSRMIWLAGSHRPRPMTSPPVSLTAFCTQFPLGI